MSYLKNKKSSIVVIACFLFAFVISSSTFASTWYVDGYTVTYVAAESNGVGFFQLAGGPNPGACGEAHYRVEGAGAKSMLAMATVAYLMNKKVDILVDESVCPGGAISVTWITVRD